MRFIAYLLTIYILININTYAVHPLRGDDATIIGTRRFQIELLGDYYKRGPGHSGMMNTAITFGLNRNSDLILTLPYHYLSEAETSFGLGDILLEYKQIFYTGESFNIGLKPFISFGSSDHEKGFGSGKNNFGLNIIHTLFFDDFSLHTNFTVLTNYNYYGEKEGNWIFSLGGELALSEKINLLTEFGISNSLSRESNIYPLYGLFGLSYSLYDNISLGIGFGKDFYGSESQSSLTFGLGILF